VVLVTVQPQCYRQQFMYLILHILFALFFHNLYFLLCQPLHTIFRSYVTATCFGCYFQPSSGSHYQTIHSAAVYVSHAVNHLTIYSQGFHPTNNSKNGTKTDDWLQTCTAFYIHISFIYFPDILYTTYNILLIILCIVFYCTAT
jgi:hypothetical protein